jgi:hypothetical protein
MQLNKFFQNERNPVFNVSHVVKYVKHGTKSSITL